MYSDVKTFDELCKIGCDFIIGKTKSHPFLIIDQDKDNLYELVDSNTWIRDYLFEYNKLGFYTVMSQPGLDKPTKIYSSYLDYKKSFNDYTIKSLEGNFGIKQRAEVEGFMKLSDAMNLYQIIKDDPRIVIGIGFGSTIGSGSTNGSNISVSINRKLKSIEKYATLSYKTVLDQDILMELESDYNEIIRSKSNNILRNIKLQNMKHVTRRYFVTRTYPLYKHIPNLLDKDIVGVSLMDLEWNSNNYLWEKIYSSLKKIKK